MNAINRKTGRQIVKAVEQTCVVTAIEDGSFRREGTVGIGYEPIGEPTVDLTNAETIGFIDENGEQVEEDDIELVEDAPA